MCFLQISSIQMLYHFLLCKLWIWNNNIQQFVHQIHTSFLHLFFVIIFTKQQKYVFRYIIHHMFVALNLKQQRISTIIFLFWSFKFMGRHPIEVSKFKVVQGSKEFPSRIYFFSYFYMSTCFLWTLKVHSTLKSNTDHLNIPTHLISKFKI
jgi:hypothetical protein